MQQSNGYILRFTVILTVVLGGLLAGVTMVLRPTQQKSIELDTKKQILGAVTDLSGKKGQEILDFYNSAISSIVVDVNGNAIDKNEKGEDMIAEKVNIAKNYKKDPESRQFPVFIFHAVGDESDVQAYILPVYGVGLWGPIWGYVALDTDLNTVKGIAMDHETETPGLGARITSDEVKDRYKGKKLLDQNGDLVSIVMLKGENNPAEALDDHTIDGLSGATLTGVGVNDMIKNYMGYYQAYFNQLKQNNAVALNN